MSETIRLDQLPPELLAMLDAHKAGTVGNRSPVHTQLKDLRPPTTEKGRLHRPSFSFSADADPEAPPYVHQEFPKLMFHARQGEVLVLNREALEDLGAGWQDTPVTNAKVTPFDAARAEFEALNEDDKALILSMQRDARMKRLQAAMEGFSEAEIASLASATPDAPKKRAGRPKATHGDGA